MEPLAVVSATLSTVALLCFAVAGVALSVIDIRRQRLPDAVVLPSLAIVTPLLVMSAALVGDWAGVGRTLGGGAVLFVGYLLIAFIHPRGMGGGDVKLAALVGVVLGWVGWSALVIGALAGFVLAALWALFVMRTARRSALMPFGPFMLVGAVLGMIWGESLLASVWAVG